MIDIPKGSRGWPRDLRSDPTSLKNDGASEYEVICVIELPLRAATVRRAFTCSRGIIRPASNTSLTSIECIVQNLIVGIIAVEVQPPSRQFNPPDAALSISSDIHNWRNFGGLICASLRLGFSDGATAVRKRFQF